MILLLHPHAGVKRRKLSVGSESTTVLWFGFSLNKWKKSFSRHFNKRHTPGMAYDGQAISFDEAKVCYPFTSKGDGCSLLCLPASGIPPFFNNPDVVDFSSTPVLTPTLNGQTQALSFQDHSHRHDQP